ncbi:ABC transporter permease [Nitratireductor sp. StC3]|uniref:ABC transporter permease n=1 Tax=Nitratireductor sp. StC3 TaxID=2126741 RepID=UPI000D0E2D13|nr:ABC transporter permease [Nitratireductor sp. StC3]PSM20372.1 ABC transporter permease [Nitratireductor sp. StC3]
MASPTSETLKIWVFLILPLPVLVVLGYVVPTAGVLGWSFTLPEPGVQNYAAVLESQRLQTVIWRTLRICLLTTVISVGLAYLIAYRWRFATPRGRQLIELVVLVSFWLSMLIRAFAWLVLLRGDGVINQTLLWLGLIEAPLPLVRNEFGAVLGMVHFMVPFAVLPMLNSFREVDDRVLNAARSLGATPGQVLRDIFFPLTLPGMAAASGIVFIFSLGSFVTPALLGGGRAVMLAEYIYLQMFQLSNWGMGATLAIVLMAMVVVTALIFGRLFGFKNIAGGLK